MRFDQADRDFQIGVRLTRMKRGEQTRTTGSEDQNIRMQSFDVDTAKIHHPTSRKISTMPRTSDTAKPPKT